MAKPKTFQCKVCSGDFISCEWRPNRTPAYCSKKCMAEGLSQKLKGERRTLICPICRNPFEVPDRPSRKNAQFCSKKCMGEGQSGTSHWNYKHGLGDNTEESKAKAKAYRARPENKAKAHARAFLGKIKRRQMNVEGSHTFEQWIELLRAHDNCCFYCGIRMTKKLCERQRTRDHLIPISRGGSDDISNIVPACRSCNSKKGDKTYEEWKRVTVTERTAQAGTE